MHSFTKNTAMRGALLTVLLLFYYVGFSNAQTFRGCRGGGQIYTSPPSGIYGWTSPVSESCPTGATNTTPRAQFIRNAPVTPGTCPIGLLSLGGQGILVDYQIVYCPIDDLLPLVFVPISLLALFKLRSNSKIKLE